MSIDNFKVSSKNSKVKDVKVNKPSVPDVKVKNYCKLYGKTCMGSYCSVTKEPSKCSYLS
jgi:hypothetical protein